MRNGRFRIGSILSVAYSLIWLVYGLLNHELILRLDPNEFAEFLAGMFAPLAFLWLVLGFLQQGEELRNSNDALRLQEEELHRLVDQQAEMVTVTRDQLNYQQERAKAAEREACRLAQPTLVMRGGTSRSSADARRTLVRGFTLANVGTTCTSVRVDFGDLRQPARYSSLTNGDERSFDLTFDLDKFDESQIHVDYIDGRGERGKKDFLLKRKGDRVSVVHGASDADADRV